MMRKYRPAWGLYTCVCFGEVLLGKIVAWRLNMSETVDLQSPTVI